MAQVVEHVPYQGEALSSNPSTELKPQYYKEKNRIIEVALSSQLCCAAFYSSSLYISLHEVLCNAVL
jgi:hypothetical protein